MILKDDKASLHEFNTMKTIAWMLFPDDTNAQQAWLVKRLFTHIRHETYSCLSRKEYLTEQDASAYIGSLFGKSIFQIGGWDNAMKLLFMSDSEAIDTMTLRKTMDGFTIGNILSNALSNGGDITKACEKALECSHYTFYEFSDAPDSMEFRHRELSSSDSIRKNLWYKNIKVSHFWVAATMFFYDPHDMANRSLFSACPFDIIKSAYYVNGGFETFLHWASKTYDAATSFHAPFDGREKPIISNKFPKFPRHLEKYFDE